MLKISAEIGRGRSTLHLFLVLGFQANIEGTGANIVLYYQSEVSRRQRGQLKAHQINVCSLPTEENAISCIVTKN